MVPAGAAVYLLIVFLWDPKARRVERRTRHDGRWGWGWMPASARPLVLFDYSGPLFWLCSVGQQLGVCLLPQGLVGSRVVLIPCSAFSLPEGGLTGKDLPERSEGPLCLGCLAPPASFLPQAILEGLGVLKGAVGAEQPLSREGIELLVPTWARRRPEVWQLYGWKQISLAGCLGWGARSQACSP